MTNDDLRRLPWRTSSYSGNSGNCVEVAGLHENETRYVRDTKDRQGGLLVFGSGQWAGFISRVKIGWHNA